MPSQQVLIQMQIKRSREMEAQLEAERFTLSGSECSITFKGTGEPTELHVLPLNSSIQDLEDDLLKVMQKGYAQAYEKRQKATKALIS